MSAKWRSFCLNHREKKLYIPVHDTPQTYGLVSVEFSGDDDTAVSAADDRLDTDCQWLKCMPWLLLGTKHQISQNMNYPLRTHIVLRKINICLHKTRHRLLISTRPRKDKNNQFFYD